MCVSVNLFLLITSPVSAELWMHFTAVLTLGRLLILNKRQEHSLIQWDSLICCVPHVVHQVTQMHNYSMELAGRDLLSLLRAHRWPAVVCSADGRSCVTAVSFTRLRTAGCWPRRRTAVYSFYCTVCTTAAGRAGCLHSCPHHHNSWSDGWWLEPLWEPYSGSGDHHSVSSQSGHSYSSQVLSSAQALAMADVCSCMSACPRTEPPILDSIDMSASCHCLVSSAVLRWPPDGDPSLGNCEESSVRSMNELGNRTQSPPQVDTTTPSWPVTIKAVLLIVGMRHPFLLQRQCHYHQGTCHTRNVLSWEILLLSLFCYLQIKMYCCVLHLQRCCHRGTIHSHSQRCIDPQLLVVRSSCCEYRPGACLLSLPRPR